MTPTGPTSSAQPIFGSASAVLELAVSGRWRSPEATAALAGHAAAQARAESDGACALLAEGWLVCGLATVGRGPVAVARATSALREAMRSGHGPAEGRLRVGLAAIARELGDPDSAAALLEPVLSRDVGEPNLGDPGLATDAYLEAVRCGGPQWPAMAQRAAGHIRRLRGEEVELALSALDAALANRHRAEGDSGAAASRARDGLRRLLGDPGAETDLEPISPHIAAWLTLELTLALLDDGCPDAAREAAEPALAWSGRQASLVPLTRLRLALAQRAYLPVGENDDALRTVAWAAGVVGQHDLPGLEADCQSVLAEVQERRGALPDALTAIRRAHEALRGHSLQVEQALVLLGRSARDARSRPASPGSFGTGPHIPSGPIAPDARSASRSDSRPVAPLGSRPHTAATAGRTPLGPPPPGVRSSDPLPTSANGGFAAAGPTVRLPIVPRRPADRVADGASPSTQASVGDAGAGCGVPGDGEGMGGLSGWPEEAPSVSARSAVEARPMGVTDQWPAAEQADLNGAGLVDADAGFARGGPEALGWAEAGGSGDESGPSSVDSDPPTSGFGPVTQEDSPAAISADVPPARPSELADLFDVEEDRPLGLVVLDVVTPTGPLRGEAARPLLERVAEHVRGQLPPNSRLAVLRRDVLLVVLPPVESQVVARWMRSMAGGLSARWSEYTEDTPRSAYRIAVGALEPGRSPGDTVAELCDRLGRRDTTRARPAGGGRHVANTRVAVDPIPGATTSETGTGGRRRRPDDEPTAPEPAGLPASEAADDLRPGPDDRSTGGSPELGDGPAGATGGPDVVSTVRLSAARRTSLRLGTAAGPEVERGGSRSAPGSAGATAGTTVASHHSQAEDAGPGSPTPTMRGSELGAPGTPPAGAAGLGDRHARLTAVGARFVRPDPGGGIESPVGGPRRCTEVLPTPGGSTPRRGRAGSVTESLEIPAARPSWQPDAEPPAGLGTAAHTAATERILLANKLTSALSARRSAAAGGGPGTDHGVLASGGMDGAAHRGPRSGRQIATTAVTAAPGPGLEQDPTRPEDTASGKPAPPTSAESAPPSGAEARAGSETGTESGAMALDQPTRSEESGDAQAPMAELSLGELLAGALAAYRDG